MKRSEIDAKYTWDLTRLFPDDAAFAQEMEAFRKTLQGLPGLAEKLTDRDGTLGALQAVTEMQVRLEALYCYASMRHHENTMDNAGNEMLSKAMMAYSEAMGAVAFLDPALLALPEGTLEGYLQDPDFSDYDRLLSELIRRRDHILSEQEEALLALGTEVFAVPEKTAGLLRNADLRLGKVKTEDGAKELTDASFMPFMESPNRQVRRGAFLQMMEGYGKMGNTFAALYEGQVKADIFEARARKYESARAAALFPDEVPEAVYDSLIEAVHGGLGTLAAYLELRRGRIGVPKLHMYDLYVSDGESLDVHPDIEEAFEIFLKSVAPLGEDYVHDAARALPERWIDVYENEGKQSGAYSMGAGRGRTPYVLLNHKRTYDGLSTLCHEMGHAMHTFYSNQNQPAPKADYTIFVAEVASTTNEILLNEYLRKVYAGDRKAQLSLVENLLEHFRTTVFRQTLFAEFEMKAHAMAEQGIPLTREALSSTYMDLVKLYYRKACVVDGQIANEWMRIPHFYSPFYVYKYATGFCAAVALAQNILSGDPEKVQSYRRFLTLGGSLPPIQELRIAGVDMESPDAVCRALDYFAELVLEYQELAEGEDA